MACPYLSSESPDFGAAFPNILKQISWPLNGSRVPLPGRIDPIHKVVKLSESGLSTAEGWDDEITFNTQARSSAPFSNCKSHCLNRSHHNGIVSYIGQVRRMWKISQTARKLTVV
jgi:hypothetical protein